MIIYKLFMIFIFSPFNSQENVFVVSSDPAHPPGDCQYISLAAVTDNTGCTSGSEFVTEAGETVRGQLVVASEKLLMVFVREGRQLRQCVHYTDITSQVTCKEVAGLRSMDLSAAAVKSGPSGRLIVGTDCQYVRVATVASSSHCDTGTEIALSHESSVSREFLVLDDEVLIAFVQKGKKFSECSSVTEITSSVSCEKASPRLTNQCFSQAAEMLILAKNNVKNFRKQYNRVMDKRGIGEKKYGKHAHFIALGERLKNVSCVDPSTEPALDISELSLALSQCQTDISLTCNPDNFPAADLAELAACNETAASFEVEVDVCLKNTRDAGAEEACDCWTSSNMRDLAESLEQCSARQLALDTKEALASCKTVFSACKVTEDTVASLLLKCIHTSLLQLQLPAFFKQVKLYIPPIIEQVEQEVPTMFQMVSAEMVSYIQYISTMDVELYLNYAMMKQLINQTEYQLELFMQAHPNITELYQSILHTAELQVPTMMNQTGQMASSFLQGVRTELPGMLDGLELILPPILQYLQQPLPVVLEGAAYILPMLFQQLIPLITTIPGMILGSIAPLFQMIEEVNGPLPFTLEDVRATIDLGQRLMRNV